MITTKLLSPPGVFKLIVAASLSLVLSLFITTSFGQISNICFAKTSYPIMFYDDFTDTTVTEARWSPRNSFSFVSGKTGQGILIESDSSGADRQKAITTLIPIGSIKGGLIALAANIKAENVTKPQESWNGIKVRLRIIELSNDRYKDTLWPQVSLDTGTFDWVNKSVLIHVPARAMSAELCLGIQQSSGKVWFDDVIIRVLKSPASFPAPRDSAIPIEKFHSLPALRGAMVIPAFNKDDARVLGQEWHANVIRWELGGWNDKYGLQMPDYDSVLENELTKLDNALAWCRKYGLMVVIDLHSLSKGCFTSVATQQKLVEVWKQLAGKYRDNAVVWAYDLVNEPNPHEHDGAWGTDGVLIWEDLTDKVARSVRVVDSVKPIIIESLFAGPEEFNNLRPLDFSIPRIIYSAHMYMPTAFTHQGVHPEDSIPCVYPGKINGTRWDKGRLIDALKPVREFQNKYRVPIFIGEFSAVRWAPSNSAFNYLRDCIEIFESYEWDWCYFAFRSGHHFSVEHSENRNDLYPTSAPNKRQQLLRSFLRKNVKPD